MGFDKLLKTYTLLGIPVSIEFSYPKNYKISRITHVLDLIKISYNGILIFLLFIFLNNHVSIILKDISYNTIQMPFTSDTYMSITHPEQKKVIKKKIEKIVFHGDRAKKQIALTFDADMTPEMVKDLRSGKIESYYDNRLVDLLNNTQTKATLFLSGMWIEEYKNVAYEISQNSLFELANHSYSHPGFESDCYGLKAIQDDEGVDEIKKTQKLLKELTGFENKLFRFPGGCYSQPDIEMTSKIGVIPIQWDVAGQDGFNDNMISIVANVVSNVKNGSIIVLHMNGYPNEPETANALPFIISTLKDRGYEFVTVSELLDMMEKDSQNVKSLFSLRLD